MSENGDKMSIEDKGAQAPKMPDWVPKIPSKSKDSFAGTIFLILFSVFVLVGIVVPLLFFILHNQMMHLSVSNAEGTSDLETKYEALLGEYVSLEKKFEDIQLAHAKLSDMFVDPHETVFGFKGRQLETNGATIHTGAEESLVICRPSYYQTLMTENGHPAGMFFGTLHQCITNLFTWDKVPVYNMNGSMEQSPQIRCFMLDDGRILLDTCSFNVWPEQTVEAPAYLQETGEKPSCTILLLYLLSAFFWRVSSIIWSLLGYSLVAALWTKFLESVLRWLHQELRIIWTLFLYKFRKAVGRMIKWAQPQ